ncbi:hypothetical protein [Candidatus Enterococcus courvalinii]|uniref:Uncharacterized protein n=1 Tax=Candidatus Enterococcus courvalinii TaxID=2815329 RepID=A0ABS3I0C0_9ENTE|nr:hypothetical protein [Enterococcus sp. MSG2901]MBO0481528.1 hypothetical protein [Enterococcus sp. MSG2901]
MTAIFKAQKNSNVSEYVKARLQKNNLDYILENGVREILKELTEELDVDYIVLWDNGTLEVSVYGEFYQNHSKSIFKNSLSGRKDIKGIRKNSRFYKDNESIFDKLSEVVPNLVAPISKRLSKEYFGTVYDGFSLKSNVEKYYFFDDTAYLAIKDIKRIPMETLDQIEQIKLSEFYSLYEKVLADAVAG